MKLSNNQVDALAQEFISKIKTKREKEKQAIINSTPFKKKVDSILKGMNSPLYEDFCAMHGNNPLKVTTESEKRYLNNRVFDRFFVKELSCPEVPYTADVVRAIHLGTIESKTVKELMDYLEKCF